MLLIRRIRDLLYEQGFTISGARNRLASQATAVPADDDDAAEPDAMFERGAALDDDDPRVAPARAAKSKTAAATMSADQLRIELLAIRRLLTN